MKKRILSILLAVCLLVGVLPLGASAATVTEQEGNDTLEASQKVSENGSISGNISETQDADFYTFTLSEPGRLHIFHKAYSEGYSMILLDPNGKRLWCTEYNYMDADVGFQTGDYDLDLEAGTYYLEILGVKFLDAFGDVGTTGAYNTTLSFTSASTNHSEPNNSIDSASQISFGSQIRGLISITDYYDFFKFDLQKDTKITLQYLSYSKYFALEIYNDKGKSIWEKRYLYRDSSLGFSSGEYGIDLDKGTYYLKTSSSGYTGTEYTGESEYTGKYNFTITTDGSPTDPDDPVAVTGVSLNKTSLELKEGETASLTATVKPTNASNEAVTWSSSNTSVATVTSSGTVKAVSEGTATITAKTSDGGYTARCTVTVTADDGDTPYVTSFSVNGVSGRIDGDSKKITVTLPKDAESFSFKIATNQDDALIYLDDVFFNPNSDYTMSGKPPYHFTLKLIGITQTEYQVEVKVGSSGSDSKFQDVPSNTWYYESVQWAVENNITSGTDKNHFSPHQTCTRAQAVTFLWNAAGKPEPQGSASTFTDVKSGSYYAKAVKWAVENNITSGTGNGKFSPDSKCTRAQIVTFLWKSAGSPSAGGSSFSDISGSAYYNSAVAWAVGNNITAGTGNGKFSPNSNCTRAQIVTFLYKYAG